MLRAIFLGFSIICLSLLAVPEPETLVALSARTEIADLTPANEQSSAFVLHQFEMSVFRADDWAPPETVCKTSPTLIAPMANAKITLLEDGGTLRLDVNGGAILTNSVEDIIIPENTKLRLQIGTNACPTMRRVRLPLYGRLTVGEDIQYAADTDFDPKVLRSGELAVYGRSTGRFLGIPLQFGPFIPDVLYKVDDIELLPNSVIENARRTNSGDNYVAEWWGYADWTKNSGVIELNVASNATEITIMNPALRALDQEGSAVSDRLSLSLFARLTGDPNLRMLYGILAFFLLVLPALLIGKSDLPRSRKEPVRGL